MVILRDTAGEEVKRYETTDRFRDCIRVNSMSLSDMDFVGKDFSFLDLSKCNPHRSRFDYGRFIGCDLRHTSWTDVVAPYADFSGSQTEQGNFYRAVLPHTRWHNVDFGDRGATFGSADLSFADFRGATQTAEINLVGADCTGMNFAGCTWPPLVAGFGEGSDIDCIDTSRLLDHFQHCIFGKSWSSPSLFRCASAAWSAVFDEHQAFDHARAKIWRAWSTGGHSDTQIVHVVLAAIHPATPFRPQSRRFRNTLKEILQATIGVNVGSDLLGKLRKLEKSKNVPSRRKPRKKPNCHDDQS